MKKRDMFYLLVVIDKWDDFNPWIEKYSRHVNGVFKGDAYNCISLYLKTRDPSKRNIIEIGTKDDYFLYWLRPDESKNPSINHYCCINIRLFLNEAKKRNDFLGYKIIRSEETQKWIDLLF